MQWKSNEYYILWVCVCSIRYPACNELAPYCHLWPARPYYILSTLSHKRHDFWRKKKLLNIKCVFRVPLQLLSEIFFILRKFEQDRSKMCKVPFIIYQFLMKLEFSRHIVKENSNIKFRENLSSVTDMTKLIVAFRNFANAPNIWLRIWHLISGLEFGAKIFRFLWQECCPVR